MTNYLKKTITMIFIVKNMNENFLDPAPWKGPGLLVSDPT